MTNESGFQGHAMCLRVSSCLRDLVAIFIFFFILSIVTFTKKKKKMSASHFLSLAICAPFEFIFFKLIKFPFKKKVDKIYLILNKY